MTLKLQRMKSRVRGIAVAAICVAGVAALSGCASGAKPANDAPAETTPTGPSTAFDADRLDALAESLRVKAAALPGANATAQRQAMRDVFDDLLQALPILEGPDVSAAFFRQGVTLRQARDRLAADTGAAGTYAAVVSGLRATAAVLDRFGADEPYASVPVTALLEELDAKLGELDAVAPVGRPYAAADAAGIVAEIVHQMATPTTGAATQPAT